MHCICNPITMVAKNKKNWQNSKLQENNYLFWSSILVTPFSPKFEFLRAEKKVPRNSFCICKCASFFIFIFSFWGLKLSLLWITMSLLLPDVVSKPIFSLPILAAYILISPPRTNFLMKISALFFSDPKILNFLRIKCHQFWYILGIARSESVGRGEGEITHPLPPEDISCFRGQYK